MTATPAQGSAIRADRLPQFKEAALLYADNQVDDTRRLLLNALDAGGVESAQAWDMLFDLHRTQGSWQEFEALATRYVQTFGRAAPPWIEAQSIAWLPAPLLPGGDAYFMLAGPLDAQQALLMEQIGHAARMHPALHLDLTRVRAATEAGSTALLNLLRTLIDQGNSVHLTGAERLAAQLREVGASSADNDQTWALALELYRLRGRQGHFQRTALEYALATGRPVPEWQPALMPLVAVSAPSEKRNEPRYQAGPDQIQFDGTLAGPAHPQLSELTEFAAERRYINIVMSQLDRIDLACASTFVDLVNRFAQSGKTVRLIRPNSLVHALLSTFTLDPRVVLIRPAPTT